jgi:hypothetical protein
MEMEMRKGKGKGYEYGGMARRCESNEQFESGKRCVGRIILVGRKGKEADQKPSGRSYRGTARVRNDRMYMKARERGKRYRRKV